jgi:hypothetical protein
MPQGVASWDGLNLRRWQLAGIQMTESVFKLNLHSKTLPSIEGFLYLVLAHIQSFHDIGI